MFAAVSKVMAINLKYVDKFSNAIVYNYLQNGVGLSRIPDLPTHTADDSKAVESLTQR